MPTTGGPRFSVEIVGSSSSPITVQGGAADGAAASGNPVLVGGMDGSGNTQTVLTDTTGAVRIAGSIVTKKLTPTVSTSPAYTPSPADNIGGKLEFTNAVRTSGGSGWIRAVRLVDQNSNLGSAGIYDIVFFDSDPTGTTFTDNAAFDVADADMAKVIATMRISSQTAGEASGFNDNAALFKQVEIPFVLTGTSLYAAVTARGTGITFAATTDFAIAVTIDQN